MKFLVSIPKPKSVLGVLTNAISFFSKTKKSIIPCSAASEALATASIFNAAKEKKNETKKRKSVPCFREAVCFGYITTAIFSSILFFSCSNGQNKTANETIVENINVKQFSLHFEDAQILDVRTPEEWAEGIIEGAILYDFFSDNFEENIGKLDKEKPVAVYCRSGGRSGKVTKLLQKLGFKENYNLNGGMNAWKSEGHPTVSP